MSSHNSQNTFTRIKEGLILINKAPGLTSFDVIYQLRKILKIKKAGHAGTLDKAAQGLLLVCLGRSTKLLKFLFGQSKTYLAGLGFGTQTTTDDLEGEIVQQYNGQIDLDQISTHLKSMTGKIKQRPPDYSAVHINGKRAYQIARNLKQKPDLKEREVEIFDLELIKFDHPLLTLKIHCSSGTYIRSLARDLGQLSHYYAHLASLIRTNIGAYSLEQAYTLDEVKNNCYQVIPPAQILDFPSLEIKEQFSFDLKNGKKIQSDWFEPFSFPPQEKYFKVLQHGKLLAVIQFQADHFKYELVY